jgi:predicted nucleic acid-binding protein
VKLDVALEGVSRLFFDSAPVIYFFERNPSYVAVLRSIFRYIEAGALHAITSPVTLAECLVAPYRSSDITLVHRFTEFIVFGHNTTFVSIDQEYGDRAAELRARYNLALPDALQLAVALRTGGEAILTNGLGLRRVAELRSIIVGELEL